MSELRDATPRADGPVIEATDLRVWYATDRGPVRAVDGVTFSLRLQPQWNQIFQGVLLVLSIAATTLLQHLTRLVRDRAPA